MALSNILSGSLIKSFIPMIKEKTPLLEAQIASQLSAVDLRGNEDYPAIVITTAEGKIYITVCAFDHDDQLMRQIQSITLPEFIEKLLNNDFQL